MNWMQLIVPIDSRTIVLPDSRCLRICQGHFIGGVRLSIFTHPAGLIPTDGAIEIECLFRVSNGRLLSYRTHSGPHEFFFADGNGNSRWDGFLAQLEIVATLDWRKNLIVSLDDGTKVEFRLKYSQIHFGFMVSDAGLVVVAEWPHDANEGRLFPPQDGRGYYLLPWSTLLWRISYRKFSRWSHLPGPDSVTDVVDWTDAEPNGIALPGLPIVIES